MSYVKRGNVYYLHFKTTPWAEMLSRHLECVVTVDFSVDLLRAPIEPMSDHELDDLFYMLAASSTTISMPNYFPVFHRFNNEIERMRFIRDKFLFGTRYELSYDSGFGAPYCLLEWRIV
jgi:hypothetical protein